MRRLIWCVVFLTLPAMAAKKIEIEVIDSEVTNHEVNQPARFGCANGLIQSCGYRGAETLNIGVVQISAKVNGTDVVLTCTRDLDKHCATFKAGKYPAEPHGKDELILFGWANPLYKGDLSKATKVRFKIGYQRPAPAQKN